MGGLFSHYNGVEIFFLICAIVGGFFVVIKFVMQFIGMDHDAGSDIDAGGHDFDGHHSDSDIGFKMLSLHGITSFLMMFGLVGLALYRQSGMGVFIAMIGAVAAGFASVWIIGKMFFMVTRLKSSGTITIDSTVGAEGKVYTKIPENGAGRVLVKVRNSLREYDATSDDSKSIETGTPIRVVWVDGNVLVVERI
jgi:membrane protein implicated in regulation of membrane protease activity